MNRCFGKSGENVTMGGVVRTSGQGNDTYCNAERPRMYKTFFPQA